MNRKLTLLLSAALVSAAFSAAPSLAATVRIDQARIHVELKPGETKTDQIRVENPSEEPATVKIYAEDWSYKDIGDGDKDFFPAGTLPRSASRWLTANPVEMTIPAFGQDTINYSITVPKTGVEGSYYTVLFFETVIGEAVDTEGASVLVSGRVGSLIYVNIAGTVRRAGKIDKLEIKAPSGAKPAEFAITFANTGNTPIGLEGEYMIMSPDGQVKGRGEITPIYTKEGAVSTRTTTWSGRIEPGTYDVVFTFDLGENQILVEEKKMQVGASAS